MCDTDINRRAFTAASIAAGAIIGAASVAHAEAQAVVETDVTIKTPDGETDAALFTPAGHGAHPGVVMFTDIIGLRPAFRDMGRRLAAEGYVVVVPNPFYRTKKGRLFEGPFDFGKDGAKLQPHLAPLTPEATQRDEIAWVDWINAAPRVSKTRKLGVVGYCMGGSRVVQASALRPERVGAAMSCHGAGLVTDKPSSPHLLAPKIKAKTFFAIAQNDAAKQPDQREKLAAAWAAAGNPCGAEVFHANHGWCVPDGASYDKAEAERAWAILVDLFKHALA